MRITLRIITAIIPMVRWILDKLIVIQIEIERRILSVEEWQGLVYQRIMATMPDDYDDEW